MLSQKSDEANDDSEEGGKTHHLRTDNQFKRRNLKPYDRSVLALQLEPLYAAEAKRRQQVHGSTAPGKPKSVSQKSDEVSDDSEEGGKSYHLRTDEQLAKLAGTSRDTIDARESVKSGEKQPTVGIWVTSLAEDHPNTHAT